MQSLPTVLLRPGEADRILAGHPWIYEGAILRQSRPADDGAIVQVKDHRQRFLGVGVYNGKSRIRVRILSVDRRELDESFFAERIEQAWRLRQHHMPEASSLRIVNAESDGLSGLIVDKYEDVLVVQTSSLAMDQRKDMWVSILRKLFSPSAILERNETASRKFEGLADSNGALWGTAPERKQIRLNQLLFEVPLLTGHKTGCYLDQQENYRQVERLIARYPRPIVLDCFSFLGGFALHAARAGALRVHGLDQSAEAVGLATRNAELNRMPSVTFEAVNVFDWLKAKTTTSANEKLLPQFDVIILDPPSFTRNRASVGDALRGYKEIHLRALKLLKTGGTLATFCCSHHVDDKLFLDVILSAAFDARRWLRQVSFFGQSADHPILPAVPETQYLKGFAFEVIR